MPVEVKLIENRIPELVAKVEATSRAAVKKVADRVAASARAYVPVDTGELQDSIRSEAVAYGHEATVTAGGDDVDYAWYVEFGTYKMAAQPYLGPAMDEHEMDLPAEIRLGFEL